MVVSLAAEVTVLAGALTVLVAVEVTCEAVEVAAGAAAVTVGYGHTQCQVTLARYTSHLVVEALSGYKNGKVRQRGKLKKVY